jgi:hypothetical protein
MIKKKHNQNQKESIPVPPVVCCMQGLPHLGISHEEQHAVKQSVLHVMKILIQNNSLNDIGRQRKGKMLHLRTTPRLAPRGVSMTTLARSIPQINIELEMS